MRSESLPRRTTSGPSDKAVQAAFNALPESGFRDVATLTLATAYPIIRADVIAEVVEALSDENQPPSYASVAGFIRARFGA